MSEETREPQVVELNVMGAKPEASTPDKPKRAWFPDEKGFTGEPIHYGGARFYAREVKKSVLRQFGAETKRIQRETALLGKKQEDELKTLQKDDADAELPDDRLAFYDDEGEKFIDELNAAYDKLLTAGIVGWDLPRPFAPELLCEFDKVDKVALCQAIGSRSTSGMEAVKNLPGRSNR